MKPAFAPIFAMNHPELYVPHAGWLRYEPDDEVARFLAEGWFEYKEQAFLWLYLRPGDTFLDGGAHAGLYSVVAGRVMNNCGSIVAVEPHPGSASLLHQNLEANGVTCGVVRQAALFSRCGELMFHVGGPGKSAYSSIGPVDGSADAVPVEGITLDVMLKGLVQLAKFDVEGAELEVLAGAAENIRQGLLPVLIVECTEANLARSGATTEALFVALQNYGYTVCRFDALSCRLLTREYDGPIGYDNLFAVQHLDEVNQRLATAAESNRRIANDILTRGAAAEKIFIASSRLDEAVQSADQANWRAEQAENRAGAAERHAADARSAAQESERRAEESAQSAEAAYRSRDEANGRAEQAEKRAEVAALTLADTRQSAEESEKRAEAASQRAEESAQSAEAAYRSRDEANWRAEQAEKRAEEAALTLADTLQSAEETERRAEDARQRAHRSREAALHSAELASQTRLRLNEVLASRYLRAGWKIGLARKPAWVDGEPEPVRETEMMRALRHLDEKNFRPRTVLDIGAGKGYWSILAGGYFKDAKFYLLEPLTENERDLRSLCDRDPRQHYIRTAVGQEPGERQIHVASDPDSSTMLLFPGDDAGRLRPLSVTTVDRLLEEGRIEAPDLVKIDVQGMELQVLQGCTRLFDHTEVFVIEVNLFAFMPGCPRVHEIVQFMADHGYSLFDLAGSLRRPFEDDLGQLDLVMVSAKSPLIASSRWV
jgi:FkbM family methyltransferase